MRKGSNRKREFFCGVTDFNDAERPIMDAVLAPDLQELEAEAKRERDLRRPARGRYGRCW